LIYQKPTEVLTQSISGIGNVIQIIFLGNLP